ncbi:MAG: M48 family metallopeptidase [Nanoarchaeota archaeon]
MKKVHVDFRDEIARNKIKSVFLIAIIVIVFAALGWVVAMVYDPSLFFIFMIISIVISILYTLFGYYNSDKIALASVNAKPASRQLHRQFYSSVESLTVASGLPMPRLYVMNSGEINAFASGRDPKHAVVCVTTGALEKLDKYELEGVLAHEMSHIADYDIRFTTLAAVLVGMVAIISEIFLRSLWMGGDREEKSGAIFIVIGVLLAILAPIAVQLVQLAISRKREYAADASAVKFTRYPEGLIKALKKIRDDSSIVKANPIKNKVVSSLLFVSPSELFSTHPAISKRIDILERM